MENPLMKLLERLREPERAHEDQHEDGKLFHSVDVHAIVVLLVTEHSFGMYTKSSSRLVKEKHHLIVLEV